MDRQDVRLTAWENFENLEDQISFNPELHDEMEIDTCGKNFSGAVLKALTALAPSNSPPRDDPPRVEERPVECDTRIPRCRRPIDVKNGHTCDESSYSVSPLVTPRGIALLNPEKAEALSDRLVTQFQSKTVSSGSAIIEMVEVALRSYFLTPASEP